MTNNKLIFKVCHFSLLSKSMIKIKLMSFKLRTEKSFLVVQKFYALEIN